MMMKLFVLFRFDALDTIDNIIETVGMETDTKKELKDGVLVKDIILNVMEMYKRFFFRI